MCGGGKAPHAQPPIEPMKNVDVAMGQAADSTSRQQALRRGLMGLYTRYSPGSAATSAVPGGSAEAVSQKAETTGG